MEVRPFQFTHFSDLIFLALSFKWLRTLSLSPFVLFSHGSLCCFPLASSPLTFTKVTRHTDWLTVFRIHFGSILE